MSKSAKETFLENYDREHEITMRVLRAYPEDQLDLKPSPKSNSARDLAWTLRLERYLGTRVWNDEFAKGFAGGAPPKRPDSWSGQLDELEKAHKEFRALVASATEEDLQGKVKFFTAPKTMGDISRLALDLVRRWRASQWAVGSGQWATTHPTPSVGVGRRSPAYCPLPTAY